VRRNDDLGFSLRFQDYVLIRRERFGFRHEGVRPSERPC
jgi:hypothetical protein